jgi:hypothetical protein
VPSSVRRLLERLDDRPIAVYDAMWTLVTWNPMWTALMGDPSELQEQDRNTLWRHFTDRPSRRIHDPAQEDEFEASMVADLRMRTGRYPEHPQLRALVAKLCQASERFRTLWGMHQVVGHVQPTKSIEHPHVGRLDLDCDVLTAQRGDLRIVVYTATPGSESDSKLALLAAVGNQSMESSGHHD